MLIGNDPNLSTETGRGYLRFNLNAITPIILNNMTGVTLVLRTGNTSSGTNNVYIRELPAPPSSYLEDAYFDLGNSGSLLLTTGLSGGQTHRITIADLNKIKTLCNNSQPFLLALVHQSETSKYVRIADAMLEIAYTLPNVTISGSSSMCPGSSSTFSATNWQAGLTWDVNSNYLSINGINTNSSVSVSATNSGSGWVRVMSGSTELTRLNVLVQTATVSFINKTVTTNETVTSCGDINVQNVQVTSPVPNQAKLTLDAAGEVNIISDFEVALGSELEIK